MTKIKGMKNKADILIIGAGATGLMATRELAKAGKSVIILEARNRIGGRIFPLSEKEFGYSAQGGAEFVHGKAPITVSLAKEAGVTLIPVQGDQWSSRRGNLVIDNDEFVPDPDFLRKLSELKEDMPVWEFLAQNFSDEKYATMRNVILRIIEGYDAADPMRISTFALRDEWLGGKGWEEHRIEGGYGTLLNFLESECRKNGAEVCLGHEVESVELIEDVARVKCKNGVSYDGKKVIVTVPISVLNSIRFDPPIPKKIRAASKLGFGGAIKTILRFKDRWWVNALGKDFSKLTFMFTNEKVAVWWTQYPQLDPVLTSWIAGPASEKLKSVSDKEILDLVLQSLAKTFEVKEFFLREKLLISKVINWPADPFARGAYSYPTLEAQEACAELAKPEANKIFFAGDALYSGKETAIVEGALGSGKEVAGKILEIMK